MRWCFSFNSKVGWVGQEGHRLGSLVASLSHFLLLLAGNTRLGD